MDPSWHHNYASLAWTGAARRCRARRALSLDQARAGRADLGAARPRPRRRPARAIRRRCAGLRGQVPASARSARGADQARPAVDREDGRAPAGAVPGAAADPAAAPARVAEHRQRSECGALPLPVGRGDCVDLPRSRGAAVAIVHRAPRRACGTSAITRACRLRAGTAATNSSISPRLWKCLRTTALAARASRLRSARNKAR